MPLMKTIIQEVASDPWPIINSHKSAGHPIHKLEFLAELGLDSEDLGLDDKLDRIIDNASEEGMLRLPMIIPKRYGGDGKEGLNWALCDSPILAYSLVKLGRGKNSVVAAAVRKLVGLGGPHGYKCMTGTGFRGPGRKDDPCPYATLLMLKLLSATEPESEAVDQAAGVILNLWAESRTKHPYMFFMGTDFRKLKFPFIWYDVMHVSEVLTRFERLRQDPRLVDMVSVIAAQGDAEGRYTPGSVWDAWREWDFGQKKVPSRTLTVAVQRILSRMDGGPECFVALKS